MEISRIFTTIYASAILILPLAIASGAGEVGIIARQTSVLIDGQNSGSGVIIAKKGKTYLVLTAKHVLPSEDEYNIVTPDGAKYPVNYTGVEKLQDVDLAITSFSSDRDYSVATIGNSDEIAIGQKVFIAGWPHPEAPITETLFFLTEGNIAAISPRPLSEGYKLVYTNVTKKGMSGGAVLNEKGELIGIHGQAQGKEVYLGESGSVALKSGFNLGIPIAASGQFSALKQIPRSTPVATTSINTEQSYYFQAAPRLLDYATTQERTRRRGATYYFSVEIPSKAQAPLQQLLFEQTNGVEFLERYHLEETRAFEGTRRDRGKEVSLSLVAADKNKRTITVTFNPPIEAGKTVTIGLRPVFTPAISGVYQLRVTAFPPGKDAPSLTLGSARLHFYDR